MHGCNSPLGIACKNVLLIFANVLGNKNMDYANKNCLTNIHNQKTKLDTFKWLIQHTLYSSSNVVVLITLKCFVKVSMLIEVLDDFVFLFPTFSVVSVLNCTLWFPFLSARFRSATKMNENEYKMLNY